MTDENKAKIREALTWMDHFAKRHCDGTIEHVANEALDALALLDAEDTPSVPISDMDYEAAWGEIAYEIEHGGDPVAVLRANFPEPAQDAYDSIAEVIAAHGYLADPADAPRVAHLMREALRIDPTQDEKLLAERVCYAVADPGSWMAAGAALIAAHDAKLLTDAAERALAWVAKDHISGNANSIRAAILDIEKEKQG